MSCKPTNDFTEREIRDKKRKQCLSRFLLFTYPFFVCARHCTNACNGITEFIYREQTTNQHISLAARAHALYLYRVIHNEWQISVSFSKEKTGTLLSFLPSHPSRASTFNNAEVARVPSTYLPTYITFIPHIQTSRIMKKKKNHQCV